MPRYYMHLRDGVDELLDQDGSDLPDLDAARTSALESARELLAADMTESGILDVLARIDIENEAGEVVHSLQFADAFTCRSARPRLTARH